MRRGELSPAERRAMTARASVCRCGRAIYLHTRRVVPNAGTREYVCGLTRSRRFESATLPAFEFHSENGLVIHRHPRRADAATPDDSR